MYTCKCDYCNKEFESRFKDVKICNSCKNRPCEVCGKPFVHDWPYDQHCCSKECRQVWKKDPERNAVFTAKRKETLSEKYGVDNVSKLAAVKVKIRSSKQDPESYNAQKASEKENEIKVPVIRKCILCGQEFEAIGSQTTCSGPHFRTCMICGKEFEFKHISDKRQTCSRECQSQLRKQHVSKVERTCLYCGKKFNSTSSNAKYCEGPHFKKCEICGNDFEIDLARGLKIEDFPKTCSRNCTNELTKRTCESRYGFSHASESPEAKEAARIKSLENIDKRKQTCIERYGFENYSQTPECRKKLSDVVRSSEYQLKVKATMQNRYGVEHAMQLPEFARKHSASQFKHVVSDGNRVDSSWEAIVYEFLLRNNIPFEYNCYSIPIEYNGITHVTHIDFKIGDLLFEVKGGHLLEGTFDYRQNVLPIGYKIAAYKKHHVIIITDKSSSKLFGRPNSAESNGLKYLNKCPEPLIGVDISLFNFPDFPYSEDRPPCFYNVRVDDSPSSIEAFNDEKTRWKMILNRINYSGGFIDAKQVLTAMNVIRTCKQPSWFSKSLAKRIIQQYCRSDVIVDPFAGWGMRHDAAVEMHRTYIGGDFNPELVKWHNEHGRNIQLKDAHEFIYGSDCSVFICPPYSDPNTGRCFEDYNFEGFDQSAKSLSQCDWLKIVMRNVPNAREYVMVCKIVDEEFKSHVVETIENKSHFGTNNEYVVVVRK